MANQIPSVKQVMAALRNARLKIESLEQRSREPIAIIGMSCRFPGDSDTPEKFWRLLQEKVDAIRPMPLHRRPTLDDRPEIHKGVPIFRGGFLEHIDGFDAAFFAISPKEAKYVDPQQRFLLETTWEALERAGIAPESLLNSNTGVFVGIGGSEYDRLLRSNPESIGLYHATGTAVSTAAGRISYVLGLSGPAMAVDTACSSSLVATHLACQSLRNQECNLALASGIELIVTADDIRTFADIGALSIESRCKTFDAMANGYVFGEGCGVVVLKRLSDALNDGDNILALIRGNAINQDGRSNGLTAPSQLAQEAVIRQALKHAGVKPAQVSYVETHGTGTSLGDPIEVNALGNVFHERENPLIMGAVKSNIGHLAAAAGVAGLIKAVLALQHGEIPANLHFSSPNPHIWWDDLPVTVPTEPTSLKGQAINSSTGSGRGPLVGVSAFGFSGTNAHLIVEGYPTGRDHKTEPKKTTTEASIERPCHLLTLSAKTKEALTELIIRYADHLRDNPDLQIADVCFTANTGRSHFSHRLSVVGHSSAQFQKRLQTAVKGKRSSWISRGTLSYQKPKIAFLFTGQGSQYVGMGKQLYQTSLPFRATIARCDEILRPYLAHSLLDILGYKRVYEGEPLINRTAYAQPALFALEYALATLWQAWGVKPDVVLGHSTGEYVAACVAGVFSLEDGLKLIAERARLIESVSEGGATAAVLAGADRVSPAIAPYTDQISIAGINGPLETLIAGPADAIDMALMALKEQGLDSRRLNIPHAPHSPLMDPVLDEFERLAQRVTYHCPGLDLTFISNVTGGVIDTSDTIDAVYWRRHMREPVRFMDGMGQLQAEACDIMLEIGPAPVLQLLGRQTWRGARKVWLPSLWSIRQDWEQMLQSAGTLYTHGVDIDWVRFEQEYHRRKVLLPTYPWQRQRHWLDEIEPHVSNEHQIDTQQNPPSTIPYTHPLLGKRVESAAFKNNEIQYESHLSATFPSYLTDHRVYEHAILPTTAYLEMALKAGTTLLQSNQLVIEHFAIHQALILPEPDHDATDITAAKPVQLILTPAQTGYSFQIYSAENSHGPAEVTTFQLHAEGIVRQQVTASSEVVDSPLLGTTGQNLTALQADMRDAIDIETFYQSCERGNLHYGPTFRLIKQLWLSQEGRAAGEQNELAAPGRQKALALIQLPADLAQSPDTPIAGIYELHPALLDACLQVSIALSLDDDVTTLPIGITRLDYVRSPGTEVWCEAQACPASNEEILAINFRLWTPDGQLVAKIHGLQLKQTTHDALLAQKAERGQEVWRDWLYEVVWRPQERPKAPVLSAMQPAQWLILADNNGISEQLARSLNQRGEHAILVLRGDEYEQLNDNTFRINPARTSDYQTLLAANPNQKGIIHCWSVESSQAHVQTWSTEHLQAASFASCGTLLYLMQALSDEIQPPALWLVTQGATAPDLRAGGNITLSALAHSPILGMAKALRLEYPDLPSVHVDLDPHACREEAVQTLLAELSRPTEHQREEQIAYRNQTRYVARLARMTTGLSRSTQDPQSRPTRWEIVEKGSLEHLEQRPMTRRKPAKDEIEIRVRAAGLNFRDVLNALGMYPGNAGGLGLECAGDVVAVGENIESYAVGDPVVATATGSFGDYVTVGIKQVAYKPKNLTYEQAATIPIAFLTAFYCLNHLAQMKAGDRVLIHTASGGVGQAAIQLAQQAGAEVFATASPSKWDTLTALHVKHIYNSRTLEFGREIMADTNGQGVDIVLNTLTGSEFIDKSLATLAQNGVFVEISKRDVWNKQQMAAVRPDVSYFLIDLGEEQDKEPDLIQQFLADLMKEFEQTRLLPLPHTRFEMTDAVSAFRYMQQAKHTGKIVLAGQAQEVAIFDFDDTMSRQAATYLITGGLGALGLVVAHSLVEQGAKRLILLGRSQPKPQTITQLDVLREMGAEITVAQVDVTNLEQLRDIISNISASYPLRGVVHAAGVLDDGALVNQTWSRFSRVLAPKVEGAWHLHTLTEELALDFFVLFSSCASLLGSAGQSNHAAANAFLDTLAHYRQSRGLKGQAINWGAWSEIGQAANFVSQIKREGMGAITPRQGAKIFEQLLSDPHAQIGVADMDWSRYKSRSPFLSDVQSLGEASASNKSKQEANEPDIKSLLRSRPHERGELLTSHVQEQVALILGHDSRDAIATLQGFRELGMDSLTSMELRNRLQSSLKCQLPAGVIFNHPTTESLAAYLAQTVIENTPSDLQPEDISVPDQQKRSQTAPAQTANLSSRRERKIERAGLSLCVCEWGADHADPIVCLHGTRDHGASWESMATILTAHGHQLIAPDLRGHGHSDHIGPNARYELRDFVADLDQLFDQLHSARPAKAESVILVGHSLGSIIATLYATIRPQRISKLVLVEPTLFPAQRMTFAEQMSRHLNREISSPNRARQHPVMDLRTAAERLRQVTPKMPPKIALNMAERLTKRHKTGYVWRWDIRLDEHDGLHFNGLEQEEYLSMLARVRAETTIVYGNESGWITPPEKALIHAARPNTRPIILNGGHNLHIDAPSELAKAILKSKIKKGT